MLRWLKARVTFTVCSLNTSLSGDGRKSSMTSDCSIASATAFGALRYFVFLFIHLLPFSPQSCTKDAYALAPQGEADCQHATIGFAETEEALLAIVAVLVIYRDHTFQVPQVHIVGSSDNQA